MSTDDFRRPRSRPRSRWINPILGNFPHVDPLFWLVVAPLESHTNGSSCSQSLLKKAGLHDQGFTFHTLRHTFATELCHHGKRPKVIQPLLGHSSITQTMDTYSHLLDDVDDDEFGGLDKAFG